MCRKLIFLISFLVMLSVVNIAAALELAVDFACPKYGQPGQRYEETAKSGYTILDYPPGDLWQHDPKTFEDIADTNVNVTVACGYVGNTSMKVLDLKPKDDGEAPTDPAPPGATGDPIANSWIISHRHWGNNPHDIEGRLYWGSIFLRLYGEGLVPGRYRLLSYHNCPPNPADHDWDIPEGNDVMPSITVYGDGVNPLRELADVEIQHETSDASLDPVWIEFDICGSHPNLAESVTVHFESPPGGDHQLGGAAVLNAFILYVPPAEQASCPSPIHNAENVCPDVVLSWRAGEGAVWHDVYLGTNFDDVNTADTGSGVYEGNDVDVNDTDINNIIVSWTPTTALELGTTYYWRTDEVNDPNVCKGVVWSFTTNDGNAFDPQPQDEALAVPLDANLAWTPGCLAASHDVYLGTNFNEVCDANNSLPPGDSVYKGNFEVNEYDQSGLRAGVYYYWRIDEVNETNLWKGQVWQFLSIVDPNIVVYYKFDETIGDTVYDYSGNDFYGWIRESATPETWEPENGYYDGCIYLDGDRGVIVARETLEQVDKEITISIWVNGTSAGGGQVLLDAGDDGFAGQLKLTALVPSATGSLIWRAGDDTDDVLEWFGASPAGWKGNWHHFAFVKDENAGTMSIYLDGALAESKADVNTASLANVSRNPDGRMFWLGSYNDDEGDYKGRLDDFRLYNRALSPTEIAQLFRGGDLALAWSPSPYNGQADVAYNVDLGWNAGDYADSHDVYFGTGWDDVNDANNTNHPGVDHNNVAVTSYDVGILDLGKTYYWRVDEVNGPNTWRGNIWRFRVANFITIDDFDDDTAQDPPSDDWYQLASATISLRSTQPVIGKHSMRYSYDNWFDMGPGYYSEIQTINLEPNDWTIFDQKLKLLSLWFYGQSGNDATITEQMYVILEDNDGNDFQVKYGDTAQYEDITDVQIEDWQEWLIPLNRFSTNDVNLANLDNLCIGFGIRYWFIPAGSGVVYFDNIRLHPGRCIPSLRAPPEADLNNDCEVDFEDVEVMADAWLEADVNLSPVQPPNEANLVGWWKLDDGAGSIVTDYAGYDNNGVIETIDVNAWWVSGHDGNALEFDGGRVRVPDAQNLRPLHQVSACAWIYYSDRQDAARVVVKGPDNRECYEIEISDDDTLVFHVRDGNDPNLGSYPRYAAESNDATLDRDEWIHVAGTYDGNSVRCYINGELMDKNDEPNNQIPFLSQDTNDLAIGNMCNDDRAPFEGTIDDVRVYNYALSAEEVAYIATGGTGIFAVQSVANLYNLENPGDRAINFRDFAKLAKGWFEKRLWPE